MSTPRRRRTGPWILAGLIVVAVGFGFRPQAVTVETARVSHGSLRSTLREEGKTRVVDRYTVVSPVAGVIERVKLEVGDPVTAGQTLFELDPLPPTTLDARSRAQAEALVESRRSALSSAMQRVEGAKAEAELAHVRQLKFESLRQSGDISELEIDEVRLAHQVRRAEQSSAEFESDVAEYELRSAQAALARFTSESPETGSSQRESITSPVDGVVLHRYRESEGPVAAAESIVEIGDPTRLEIEIDVLSSDAVQITEGVRVRVERWGGETPLEARVRRVEPVGFTKVSALGVEEQRVLVIADFVTDVTERRRLGDGYRIDAVFVLWEGESVRRVPASALFRERGEWAVYVDRSGRAELRRVQVGHRSSLEAEIVNGLDDGEFVILHPPDAIESGTRIRTVTD